MFTLSLRQNEITDSEKTALRLGIMILAAAIFSGNGMTINAVETGEILKGHIQENIVKKEHVDNALFLLKDKWKKELNGKYGAVNVKYIDDGVAYARVTKYINSKPVRINISEINRNINPNIEVLPQTAGKSMHQKSKINNIAINSKALLAVNGTYFKQDTGTPLGTLVIDQEIISGPIYERAALGIFEDRYETARVSFSGNFGNKKLKVKIDNINQPNMLHKNVLIYTPKWGTKPPLSKLPRRNIAVSENKITEISDIPVVIPEKGYVITGPVETLKNFRKGDTVYADYGLTPEWEGVNHVISGGPYLIKDGNIFIDASAEKLNAITGKNPRTAIGYTKDNVMIIVTVDGRKEGSSGMTLDELAKFMKGIGCIEAINLDGGSSTVMFANGNLYSGTAIRSSVAVNNALVVRRKA